MVFWIILVGWSAFVLSFILGSTLDYRKELTVKKYEIRAMNVVRAVIVGLSVGLATTVPLYTKSPFLGGIFCFILVVAMITVLVRFLYCAEKWIELLWFVLVEANIALAMRSAVSVLSLAWDSSVLTSVFFRLPWILLILGVGFAGLFLAIPSIRHKLRPVLAKIRLRFIGVRKFMFAKVRKLVFQRR